MKNDTDSLLSANFIFAPHLGHFLRIKIKFTLYKLIELFNVRFGSLADILVE